MTGKQCFTILDWEDLRFFAALARHRTLAATAKALEVAQASVSRRLASLETRLGSPLFERRARGFALTAAGLAVLTETAQMEMAACAVSQMCTGTHGRTVPGARAHGHRSSPRRAPKE
jgi:DNA-binding transcriptional LysR family regulator